MITEKLNKPFVLILIFLSFKTIHAQNKILFVTSNQDFYGNTKIPASNHFEEIVIPYDIFIKAGYQIDFISPKGGAIPIGYINSSDILQKKYLYDNFFMDKLEHTKKPTEIVAENYSAIFYSGGGAAMFGVAEDKNIQKIARTIYNKNGVVSTICHGTAGIAYLKDENGKDAAIAKAEIVIPDVRSFTDYFLLLKYEGSWKIVHKSYSWRALTEQKK